MHVAKNIFSVLFAQISEICLNEAVFGLLDELGRGFNFLNEILELAVLGLGNVCLTHCCRGMHAHDMSEERAGDY